MPTKRFTLNTEWQRIGRGPISVQVTTLGVAFCYIGPVAPGQSDEGHHVLSTSDGSLSYSGTGNLYARAKDGEINIKATATLLATGAG